MIRNKITWRSANNSSDIKLIELLRNNEKFLSNSSNEIKIKSQRE